MSCLCALAALLGVVFVPQFAVISNSTRRLEVEQMKMQGRKLVKVAKDIKKQPVPEKEELQRLAKKLETLGKKMQTGRMEKKRAMLSLQKLDKQIQTAQQEFAKANQVSKTMDQAGKEISAKTPELARKIAEQIAKEKKMPVSEAMKQVPSDKRMGELARKQGPLTESERKELEKLVQKYTKPGSNLTVPAELAEALAKLMQNSDYQKAAQLMQELAKKLNAENKNGGEIDRKMLEEQLKQLAEALKNTDLDKLAKELRENAERLAKMSPEELKKLAEQMQQCKNVSMGLSQACQSCQNASASLGISGLGKSASAGAEGSGRQNGSPGPGGGFGSDNSNSGPRGKLNDVKNVEKVSGQVGESGMIFSAGESKGAPDEAGAARVPYTQVMPEYKKEAEESLQREQVPPAYRKRVKDYFGTLE